MSGTIKKIYETFTNALDINQSILSGCIDIVVVEQPNGNLKSTPFHLRFGKFKALRGRDAVLDIYINDVKTDLWMKLGKAGEGYFDLSAFQQTSKEIRDQQIQYLNEDAFSEFDNASMSEDDSSQYQVDKQQLEQVVEILGEPIQKQEHSKWKWIWGSLPQQNEIQFQQNKEKEKQLVATIEIKPQEDQAQGVFKSFVGIFKGKKEIQKENDHSQKKTSLPELDEKQDSTILSPPMIKSPQSVQFPVSPKEKTIQIEQKLFQLPQQQDIKESDEVKNKVAGQVQTKYQQLLQESEPVKQPNHNNDVLPTVKQMTIEAQAIQLSQEKHQETQKYQDEMHKQENNVMMREDLPLDRLNQQLKQLAIEIESTIIKQECREIVTKETNENMQPHSNEAKQTQFERQEENFENQQINRELQNQTQTIQGEETVKAKETTNQFVMIQDEPEQENKFFDKEQQLKYQMENIEKAEEKELKEDPRLKIDTSIPQLGNEISFSPTQNEIVEISICQNLVKETHTEIQKMQIFEQNKISYEVFLKDPSKIISNTQVMFRHGDSLYQRDVGLAILISKVVFGKDIRLEQVLQDKKSDQKSMWNRWFGSKAPTDKQTPKAPTSQKELVGKGDGSEKNLQKPKDKKEEMNEKAEKGGEKNQTKIKIENIAEKKENIKQVKPVEKKEKLIEKKLPVPNRKLTDDFLISDTSSINSYRKKVKRSLKPTSDMLKKLGLTQGVNKITYKIYTELQGSRELSANIFLYKNSSQIVISDVDGTITKSDVYGQLMPMMGTDWSHPYVTQLYQKIVKNGYEIIYLTARGIGQSDQTKGFIKNMQQGQIPLPIGPVIMSPDRLLPSFKREVIDKNPEVFKIQALKDIRNIFDSNQSLYAGFGNRETDALAYQTVGIDFSRIFVIDTESKIHMVNTTSHTSQKQLILMYFFKRYEKICNEIDHYFPLIADAHQVQDTKQFNQTIFWNLNNPENPPIDIEELYLYE